MDSIVKGVCRLTGCVFAAEESISKGDRRSTGRRSLTLSDPSIQQTPQKSVSEDVIPDYKLFKIESNGGSNVLTIIEVKTLANFNDDSVCQTIGYHIASRVSTANEETLDPYPSLAIMICKTHARLIFFPFMDEKSLCMEAVVSETISILPNGMINPELFTFVCTYIDQLTKAEPAFITTVPVFAICARGAMQ